MQLIENKRRMPGTGVNILYRDFLPSRRCRCEGRAEADARLKAAATKTHRRARLLDGRRFAKKLCRAQRAVPLRRNKSKADAGEKGRAEGIGPPRGCDCPQRSRRLVAVAGIEVEQVGQISDCRSVERHVRVER